MTIKNSLTISLLAAIISLGACKNPALIAHRSAGVVYSATIDSIPPGKAYNEKTVHTYGSFEPRVMSISPDAKYIAIAQQKSNPNPKADEPQYFTEIKIYHLLQNKLLRTYTQADLLAIAAKGNGAVYGNSFAFYIIQIDWMNNKSIYINGQPDDTRVESVPQNTAFGFDAMSKNKTHGTEFYPRSNQPNLKAPIHPSKTKFKAALVNGQVQVEGQNVVNLRSGIEAFDINFIGK